MSLWDLQQGLSQYLAVLQPTTIDEFRTDIEQCPMALLERFYPREFYREGTMYEFDEALRDRVIYDDLDADEVKQISAADCAIARAVADVALDVTNLQVTARDLQLVSQADHLVVLRPRFNGRVSTGVYREISEFNLRTAYLRQGGGNPRRQILVLDTRDDDRMHWARQLISKLVFANSPASEYGLSLVQTAAWSEGGERGTTPRLDATKVLDYVAQITDETHERIRRAADSSDLTSVAEAVDFVVRDLGWGGWSLGQRVTPRPLDPVQTFPYRQDRRDKFLQDLKTDLEPLQKREPFKGCRFVDIQGKSTSELVGIVLQCLKEEG